MGRMEWRNWRKSRRSMNAGDCVEVASCDCVEVDVASWRKPSRSGYNGNCVEAGHGPGVIGVRDTKLGAASPVLAFTPDTWTRFATALKAPP